MGAVAYLGGHAYGLYKTAELNYTIERADRKLVGGKQERYATTCDGFHLLVFRKGCVIVTSLRVDPSSMTLRLTSSSATPAKSGRTSGWSVTRSGTLNKAARKP